MHRQLTEIRRGCLKVCFIWMRNKADNSKGDSEVPPGFCATRYIIYLTWYKDFQVDIVN